MIKIFFLLSKIILCIYFGNVLAFETKAKQAFLMDYDTEEILLDKNATQRMAPSSMSKLMTILLIFERLEEGNLKLDSNFIVSEEAWKKQGSKMFVSLGSSISVEELLKGIIIQSGNDACIVVAEAISGSEGRFAQLMNEKAREIGLTDSNFTNSTGWPDENHYMNSKDLAILSKYLIKNYPKYYHYFAMKEFTYNNIKQENRNNLLGRADFKVDGLKTGSTDLGGYGIVASAIEGKRRLILVINGLNSMASRMEEAKKLLIYGMNNFTNISLFKKDEKIGQEKILFGKNEIIELLASEDILITIRKGEEKKINFKIKLTQNEAPIKKDSIIGNIEIYNEDKYLKSFQLKAGYDIEKLSYIRILFRKLSAKIFG